MPPGEKEGNSYFVDPRAHGNLLGPEESGFRTEDSLIMAITETLARWSSTYPYEDGGCRCRFSAFLVIGGVVVLDNDRGWNCAPRLPKRRMMTTSKTLGRWSSASLYDDEGF